MKQPHSYLFSLIKQADRIYLNARKEFSGGLSFGLDAPTWCAVDPVSFAEWSAKRILIRKEIISLRSAGLLPSSLKVIS